MAHVINDEEPMKQSSIDGERENLYNHCNKNIVVPQKSGTDLPQDSAILLLGIYPGDTLSYHKDT